MGGKITEIDTVSLDEANKALVIIDQTKLPGQIQRLSLTKAKEIWDAIYLYRSEGHRRSVLRQPLVCMS